MPTNFAVTDRNLMLAAAGARVLGDALDTVLDPRRVSRLDHALRKRKQWNKALSDRLAAVDRRYARRLRTIEALLARDMDRLRRRIPRLRNRAGRIQAFAGSFLSAIARASDARSEAFGAARKRHPEIRQREGRPRSEPESLLERGERLLRAEQRSRQMEQKHLQVIEIRQWFVQRINSLMDAERGLSVSQAIVKAAKAHGSNLNSARVENLRKCFHLWDKQFNAP